MESHEALERFEKITEADEESRSPGGQLARSAVVVVAVLAAFLAVATFLSNEAVKEAITGETKGADTNAQLEANDVKITVAGADALLLRVVGTGNPGSTRSPPWSFSRSNGPRIPMSGYVRLSTSGWWLESAVG